MRIFVVLGGKKTKPILFSPQIFWGLKRNLKKQSQFKANFGGNDGFVIPVEYVLSRGETIPIPKG